MEHRTYVARRRARFRAICGQVNLPYGTALVCRGGFLFQGERQICAVSSQNAHDFFVRDDDGRGEARGKCIGAIEKALQSDLRTQADTRRRERWRQVWEDPLCQTYRRPEHEDHWLWNQDFYDAPVEDLQKICRLIGVGDMP